MCRRLACRLLRSRHASQGHSQRPLVRLTFFISILLRFRLKSKGFPDSSSHLVGPTVVGLF